MTAIFRFFIDRPLLVNLTMVLIIIMGIVSAFRMKREGMPRVDMRQVLVTTFYPGASPEDVELNVTIPLENAIKGVAGIKKFDSVSMENLSRINIFLEQDVADLQEVKTDIRRAVDNVTDLPREVETGPTIFELKVQNFAVIEVALSSRHLSEQAIIRKAETLKKQIQDLPLVSKVQESGMRDREIQIKVDLNKINRLAISFNDIILAIQNHNINMTGGNIESYLSEKGIVTVSRFENVHDVEKVIIRSNFAGRRIRLKDIARVVDTLEKKTSQIRYNGRDGVSLLVVKKANADIIRTVKQLKSFVRSYQKKPASQGVDITYLNDLSAETGSKLDIVGTNAVIGLVLVIAVLFIFLNAKVALWTAAGLPISIGLAIILINFFGVTINAISLSGIIIVLGMLVDDAIIIAENTYRHRLDGMSWRDASLIGVTEVALPVIATIATTILAFMPIAFMEGMVGDFAYEIPYVVAFTLLASLCEGFFLLPNHLGHRYLPRRMATPGKSDVVRSAGIGNVLFVKLNNFYKPALYFALKFRYLLILFFIFLLIGTGLYAYLGMKFVMFDSRQARVFYISGETKSGSSLEKTGDDLKTIEDMIADYPDTVIASYKTQVALTMWGDPADSNYFTLIVYLTPANQRDKKITEVVNELRRRVKSCGMFDNVNFHIDSGGPPMGKPLEIEIISDDDNQRVSAMKATRRYLEQIDGLLEIDDNYELGKQELKIRPRYDRIARFGLLASQVARSIRTAFNGIVVTYLQTPTERIDYRLMLDDSYRRNRATLRRLKAVNRMGNMVPIRNLLRIREERSLKRIYHYNGDRTINISADINKEKITPVELMRKLRHEVPRLQKRFPHVRFEIKGETEESMRTMMSFFLAFGISLIAVYFLLVLLFNSFSKPFLIIIAVPFGMIGVTAAFAMHGESFNLMALIGIVGLVGVVVNDSLVLMSFIDSRRREKSNLPVRDIVVEGAATRLRPILLTTITTAAGLMPTAYGLGGYDFTIAPMVLAMSWGLIFATVLTLFLLPALYMVDNDARQSLRRLFCRY